MGLGRCVHELADFYQALTFLDSFDRDGGQRFAIAAVGIAVDALGDFHAAQAGAILFARDLKNSLFLGRSERGKIDGAEFIGGLPRGGWRLRGECCAADESGEIDSHVLIIAQSSTPRWRAENFPNLVR